MTWRTLLVVGAFAANCLAKNYQTGGLVLKVDKPNRAVVVSCETIPGFMEAMVMPLTVHNSSELTSVAPGSVIDFTLVVGQSSSYIEKIRVRQNNNLEQDPLGAARLKLLSGVNGPPPPEIRVGQRVPEFSLVDQSGRRIALSQLTGKVVVLTFIYTHCALPEFCFRISTNFSRLQKRFAAQLGSELVLLSITFDPVHDTPDVMAKYGKIWNADPKGWKLLSGPPDEVKQVCTRLGMSFWPDEGLMTHALHTMIIDRKGALTANLEGNKYSAVQLGDLVQTVLARPR